MNLTSANRAKEFVCVLATDGLNRPTRAVCPGHHCKHHLVRVERINSVVTFTCTEKARYDGEKLVEVPGAGANCSGGMFGVCYHALAVMLHSSERLGEIAFFEDKAGAEECQKGRADKKAVLVCLRSAHAPHRPVWMVFTPKATAVRDGASGVAPTKEVA
jgi:hypothetical protein